MKTVSIVNGPIQASAISLGCFRMGQLHKEEAAALDLGINFFDNADCYGDGQAEVLFGQAKAALGLPRDRYIIQSKSGIDYPHGTFNWSAEHLIHSAEESLRKMQTDYLDVFLLHRPDLLYNPEEISGAFDKLYESGKVRHFGVSNVKPMQIELLKRYVRQPIIVNQLQLSVAVTMMIDPTLYMNMDVPFSIDRTGDVLDYCRLNDITIQAWSPMQYGFISGSFIDHPDFPELNGALHRLGDKYGVPVAAIAIAWILRHPAGIQAIVGTMNPDHLKDICRACEFELTREEWYELYLAAGHYLP